MGLLSRIRGEHKPPQEDPELVGTANTALSRMRPPSPAERADRSDKGIDIDMIEDEKITSMIDGLCQGIRYLQVGVIPATAKDNTPLFYPDGKPILIPKYEQVQFDRQWAMALRVYVSKVWATRYMDPYEADTTKLEIKNAFFNIKKHMPVGDKRLYLDFVEAVEDYCKRQLEDSKNGNKALLLKVERQDLRVGMHRETGPVKQ